MSEQGKHGLKYIGKVNGWDVAQCMCGVTTTGCPDPATAAEFWAHHAVTSGHWERLNLIEEYVWCVDCQEPHEADLEKGVLLNQDPDTIGTCAANAAGEEVNELPEDWHEKYYALHNDRFVGKKQTKSGYLLFLREPPIDPVIHTAIRPEVIR